MTAPAVVLSVPHPEDCPKAPAGRTNHSESWYDCDPCAYCGDDTPPADCDCPRHAKPLVHWSAYIPGKWTGSICGLEAKEPDRILVTTDDQAVTCPKCQDEPCVPPYSHDPGVRCAACDPDVKQ